MGICKTHSLFPSCHSFYSWHFLQVPVNNVFFSLFFFLFFRFFFQIRHTYDRKKSVPWHDAECVYIYIYSLIPFFLPVFFVCFGSHCTISIVRVRMTLTGGRRFFLLRFFFLRQSSPFLDFFFSFSLSFIRSFTMTTCVCQKKRNKEFCCIYGLFFFFLFFLSSFR